MDVRWFESATHSLSCKRKTLQSRNISWVATILPWIHIQFIYTTNTTKTTTTPPTTPTTAPPPTTTKTAAAAAVAAEGTTAA